MDFPEAEYLALRKSGSAMIRGRAFLKAPDGGVKTAAGNQVVLNPVTSYSTEWYEKSYLRGLQMQDADPRLLAYLRTQVADGGGRFVFRNVPAGEYFITTEVRWKAPAGNQGALQVHGGVITKRIKVSAGKTIEVALTK